MIGPSARLHAKTGAPQTPGPSVGRCLRQEAPGVAAHPRPCDLVRRPDPVAETHGHANDHDKNATRAARARSSGRSTRDSTAERGVPATDATRPQPRRSWTSTGGRSAENWTGDTAHRPRRIARRTRPSSMQCLRSRSARRVGVHEKRNECGRGSTHSVESNRLCGPRLAHQSELAVPSGLDGEVAFEARGRLRTAEAPRT